MRGVLSIVILCAFGAQPAHAGLGNVLNGTTTDNTTTTGGNEDSSDGIYDQLDADFNSSVDQANSDFEASTNAINDGSLEDYTGRLDSTLEAMYDDINNGGTAAGLPTAGSYTAPTIPGSSDGSGEHNADGTHSTTTTQNQTSSDSNATPQEEEPPSDPQIAMVLEVCTPACTPESGQFDQACASNCARQVLGAAPEPSATDNLLLMSLLGE